MTSRDDVSHLSRRSSCESDGHFSRPSSQMRDLERLASSDDSTATSPCHQWPSLPDWPELDLIDHDGLDRGRELLGSMELDPTRFSRDDLCHLALEIFEAAVSAFPFS